MHNSQSIRLGTRSSKLALWQAEYIKSELEHIGLAVELVLVDSNIGDMNLKQPLYEMGVQGLFTKALDIALLNDQIDIAVHSLKDVPTQLPEGLTIATIPQRGPIHDMIVLSDEIAYTDLESHDLVIASSSLRRRAQWARKYPHHKFVNIRGNVQSRINKAKTNPDIHGTILAEAGIERLALPKNTAHLLPWMIPAPAQGALGVACRSDESAFITTIRELNHAPTELACQLERNFLRHLQGGCATAIGAHATVKGEDIHFIGGLYSEDGQQAMTVEKTMCQSEAVKTIASLAEEMLENGGDDILKSYQT